MSKALLKKRADTAIDKQVKKKRREERRRQRAAEVRGKIERHYMQAQTLHAKAMNKDKHVPHPNEVACYEIHAHRDYGFFRGPFTKTAASFILREMKKSLGEENVFLHIVDIDP